MTPEQFRKQDRMMKIEAQPGFGNYQLFLIEYSQRVYLENVSVDVTDGDLRAYNPAGDLKYACNRGLWKTVERYDTPDFTQPPRHDEE